MVLTLRSSQDFSQEEKAKTLKQYVCDDVVNIMKHTNSFVQYSDVFSAV